MAKRVVARPTWLEASQVEDVYSVSGCVSPIFADAVQHWQHNGYWLYDSPAIIEQLCAAEAVERSGLTVFYYEVHGLEYDGTAWSAFSPEPAFGVAVVPPRACDLAGFDVVSFSARSAPECSPLTCNGLAAALPVNRHGLAPTFEQAKAWLEAGRFARSEPGPYRIFAVYPTAWA